MGPGRRVPCPEIWERRRVRICEELHSLLSSRSSSRKTYWELVKREGEVISVLGHSDSRSCNSGKLVGRVNCF